MKLTLQVKGREMTFSEEELTAILEAHFESVHEEMEVAETPTDGKCFNVHFADINQEMFMEKKADLKQEWTRELIANAFAEVNAHPEKYARPFKTMIPKKTWNERTVGELEKIAQRLGDHMADWVEQALEWAQRITNGESWETVCNEKDTTNWHRLIIWENGRTRIIGGSRISKLGSSPSEAHYMCISDDMLNSTVPLVVLYK